MSPTATPLDPLFQLAPLVVLLPVLGIFFNLIFGKRLGEKGIGAVGSLAAGGSFVVSVLLGLGLARTPAGGIYTLAEWMALGSFNISWAFRIDALSVVMMLVVSGVSTLIHIYSIGYMHADVRHNGDPQRFRRFFIYLNLFVAAMMTLVSANNFLMLFVGWEGVGLCSYLLIGFWFEKGANGTANAIAAKKAFVVNRIGDFGMLIAMFLLFYNFGSLDFDAVFAQAPQVAAASPAAVLLITLFMLLAVAGKSAQLPLFVWLPDAMAGPTPVSALIHAATMVTAGVYLIARTQGIYTQMPAAQDVVSWVGGLTALFAATIAVGQNDIKKVLAYSTISQLGYMVAAVGMGAAVAGMFHLVTHAFFKALLFLSAGSVILGMEHGHEHASGHEPSNGQAAEEFDPQDMRNMGGLCRRMPLTFWVYLIGALALSGIAPLSGFFSKDEILLNASQRQPAVFILLVIAAFLTAFYMGRQIVLVFFGKPRSPAVERAVESPALVTAPLVILAALSALGGLLNFPGLHWLETWLEQTFTGLEPEGFNLTLAGISLAVALLGLLVAWLIYGRRPLESAAQPDPLSRALGPVFTGMQRKWWVDELYQALIIRPYYAVSGFLAGAVDQSVIDGAVNGAGSLVRAAAGMWRKAQNGYLRTYALTFLIGVIIMVAYLVLR